MRTIEVKLYQFEELSPEAQKRAINRQLNWEIEYGEPFEGFELYCEEKAEERGFNDIKLQYSLSNRQGDGLSFAAESIDFKKFIAETIPNCKKSVSNILQYYTTYKITGNAGRYCYASNSDVEFEFDNYTKEYPNIQTLVDLIGNNVKHEYMSLCEELEKEGYNWLESSLSEETIKDNIIANEYEFTEEGNLQ